MLDVINIRRRKKLELGTIYGTMTSEEQIRKSVRKELSILNEVRMVTYTSKILSDIGKSLPGIKKAIDIWSLANGSVGLYRYEDGNAYEIEVRPAALSKHKDIFGKYTTRHVKKIKDHVPQESIKQALWMAFGEKADKIEFEKDDGKHYVFRIYYNETFDKEDSKEAVNRLTALSEFGKYELIGVGDGYLDVKYAKGTGDKHTLDQLMSEI